MKVIIMGMSFEEGSVPDFGSIYATKITIGNLSGVNEYGLNSADISKLNNITNAAPGSTALCDDTGDIYRLTKTGWAKFGENETAAASNSASPASLNLSPLDINRNDLMNKTGSSDIEETPEEMTAEPIIDNEDMV